MARPKKRESEKLVQVPANVTQEMLADIEMIGENREWLTSQTVRNALRRGLEELKNEMRLSNDAANGSLSNQSCAL